MNKLLGSSGKPLLVIHGGADLKASPKADQGKKQFLLNAGSQAHAALKSGKSAREATLLAVELMEQSGLFNAGKGAELQSDGVARLSASLMESSRGSFSSVALVTQVSSPSRLASALQEHRNRNIGPYAAQLLARELGIPPEEIHSRTAIDNWLKATFDEKKESGSGTVGAVALDLNGTLAACTSTGGAGPGDIPERMSDVVTVAGNYATGFGAVSCTGVGEQIIDAALAARLEARLRDGMSLPAAVEKMLAEAAPLKHRYGFIVAAPGGEYAIAYTTEHFYGAVVTDKDSQIFPN